jgi:hypothetical protein
MRRDGVAREYFYVYDRTGGSSGPGIKCFVAGKTGQIENTKEVFKPRCPVEITKAGEVTGSLYFEGRSGYGSRLDECRYTIECRICGREFRRKHRNTSLRPHKDKYENRCLGRSGYLI